MTCRLARTGVARLVCGGREKQRMSRMVYRYCVGLSFRLTLLPNCSRFRLCVAVGWDERRPRQMVSRLFRVEAYTATRRLTQMPPPLRWTLKWPLGALCICWAMSLLRMAAAL